MIYLDNAATTKADQDVIDSFVKVNQSLYFNPNSPHQAGLQAEQVLKQAKEIDSVLNLNHLYHIVFTSGATESNNMALKGIAYRKRKQLMKLYLCLRTSLCIRSDEIFRGETRF